MNLDLNCVYGYSPKIFDFQILFYPLKNNYFSICIYITMVSLQGGKVRLLGRNKSSILSDSTFAEISKV